jgi:hypothetical protein
LWDSGNKSIGTFYVGKVGEGGSNYIRAIGSDDVYSVMGGIRYSFFTDLTRWRNKSLFKIDPKFIKKLTIAQKDSATIVLEKTKDSTGQASWSLTAPVKGAAVSTEVDGLCSSFATAATENWEENPLIADSATSFDKPATAVTAEMENGEIKGLIIGKEKVSTSNVFAKTTDSKEIYLLSKYVSSTFNKSVSTLKKSEPTPAQASAPTPLPPASKSKPKKKS